MIVELGERACEIGVLEPVCGYGTRVEVVEEAVVEPVPAVGRERIGGLLRGLDEETLARGQRPVEETPGNVVYAGIVEGGEQTLLIVEKRGDVVAVRHLRVPEYAVAPKELNRNLLMDRGRATENGVFETVGSERAGSLVENLAGQGDTVAARVHNAPGRSERMDHRHEALQQPPLYASGLVKLEGRGEVAARENPFLAVGIGQEIVLGLSGLDDGVKNAQWSC